MTADPSVLAARARSQAAHERLEASIAVAKARLHPKALASDAVDGVKTKAGDLALDSVDAARAHPATVVALAGAIGVVLARKPLARWIGGMFGYRDATARGDAS